MQTKLEQIKKRDGRIVPYDPPRIAQAIAKATGAVHGVDPELSDSLAQRVRDMVERQGDSGLATVEQIQDAIETVLIDAGLARAAKAFILYRARRSRIREGKSELMLAVDDVLSRDSDELPHPPESKLRAVGAAASQEYYLKRMIPEAEAVAHMRGEIHVEGLESYAKAPESLSVPLDALLARPLVTPWGKSRPSREPQAAVRHLVLALQALSSELSGPLSLEAFDAVLGDWLVEASDAQVHEAVSALLQALRMPQARTDSPLPLTIVFGDDARPQARRVARALLDAAREAEPLLAPSLVMRLRPGLNLQPGDPGHDLLQAAAALAARRMTPGFALGDEPILGGGMRLAPDRLGAEDPGRGVVASVVLNLPRLAFQARRDHQAFDSQLLQLLDRVGTHLAKRMEILGQLKARELPLLMGGLHAGSEGLGANDPLGFALRHGQLNIAFVGLAEALTLMEGAHHGESAAAQERGLATVRLMQETVAAMAERHDLNMVLSGQAADAAAVRFASLDRRDFGSLPGVTDRPSYTSAYLLPSDFSAPFERRIMREAAYHRLCPGGNGALIVPSGDAQELVAWLGRMTAEGVGLIACGDGLAYCTSCGEIRADAEACRCGSREWRRIARPCFELSPWERLSPERQAEILARPPSSEA